MAQVLRAQGDEGGQKGPVVRIEGSHHRGNHLVKIEIRVQSELVRECARR